jgi:hypothetical protein
MKTTHHSRTETRPARDGNAQGGMNRCDVVRQAIVAAKERLLSRYFPLAQEHANVLRLALNEAEALAWQTGFPHLLFPELAAEKAEGAIRWHQRQRSVRRNASEVAFAE